MAGARASLLQLGDGAPHGRSRKRARSSPSRNAVGPTQTRQHSHSRSRVPRQRTKRPTSRCPLMAGRSQPGSSIQWGLGGPDCVLERVVEGAVIFQGLRESRVVEAETPADSTVFCAGVDGKRVPRPMEGDGDQTRFRQGSRNRSVSCGRGASEVVERRDHTGQQRRAGDRDGRRRFRRPVNGRLGDVYPRHRVGNQGLGGPKS